MRGRRPAAPGSSNGRRLRRDAACGEDGARETAQTTDGLALSTWALTAAALCLVVYAAGSKALDRTLVTPALFFTAAGLLLGPGLGVMELTIRSEPVRLLAVATLTLVLFSDASRISLGALRGELGVPVRLLGIGLPLTIAAGVVVGAAVLPGITVVEALVLATMLACTDAALGQAVVSDKRVPSRIRQGLNVESGLNDGLCVPIFFIALAIADAEESTMTTSSAARLVGDEIGFGLVGGLVAGIDRRRGPALRPATRPDRGPLDADPARRDRAALGRRRRRRSVGAPSSRRSSRDSCSASSGEKRAVRCPS